MVAAEPRPRIVQTSYLEQISPEMEVAGFEVLLDSGRLEGDRPLAGDRILVRKVFAAMAARHLGPVYDIEEIAEVCHEVNRAICEASGDSSQKPWADAEDWQRASAVAGVKYTLAHPDATPADQHDAWSADKLSAGWVYGPTKDASAKTHPCLVPYDQLPFEQRVKDHAFRAVVATMTTC